MATFSRKFQVDLTQSIAHWSVAEKIKRLIWQNLVKPCFLLLPRSANNVRIFLLRMMGARIGKRCLIEPKVNVLMPWNLDMADFVVIGREVNIYNYATVTIDSMTVVSQFTFLCTGSHDYTHPHMPLTWAPITIGSECWVAADVFIAPGVSIGNGTVIGARSVVTKDMPEWVVCAGHPCKPIKGRVIKEL
jgi:putative colanic acid biosynthesis acetyltransferase WcaF